MPAFSTLGYAVHDGVATLTLNRPAAKNALDPVMAGELGELLADISRDPQVRALVITGAGGNFCSGGDVKGMGGSLDRTPAERVLGMSRYARICNELMGLDRPVIAAVDGVAFGAGFSIALMADMVLVSDRVRMCMVFHRIGLIPDLAALYTLPRVVGLQKARELIFSAREVGAAEAKSLGIAMEVLPADGLLRRAQEIAASFTGSPAATLRISKRALGMSLHSDLATMLEIEACGQSILTGDDYLKEAARRFAAKEPPQFAWPAAKSD